MLTPTEVGVIGGRLQFKLKCVRLMRLGAEGSPSIRQSPQQLQVVLQDQQMAVQASLEGEMTAMEMGPSHPP